MGSIPYLQIFEKNYLDIGLFKIKLQEMFTSNQVIIVVDTCHLHQFGNTFFELSIYSNKYIYF